MKLTKIISTALSLVLGTSFFTAVPATAAETDKLADSGLDYSESTETINNPGMGYTSTLWYNCKPNDTPVQNPSGSLVLMFIDIGAFSSGANGVTDDSGNYTEGIDYDLDEAFFTGLRGTFENCRRNGCTMALRFRYDANGKTNPEPASFEQVLHHIDQIKESGILEEYKDILMYVESGFVGAWGEQHSGKYTSTEYKAQLLDAMLDAVPDDIPVTVRTANIFSKWAGIEHSAIDTWVSEPGSKAARVGMYNDGYMGSDSDLGTYNNREKETTWLGNQTVATYYGGEFSGNLDWAKKYDTYLPENAIPEMYKTHLSYINSNIYNLYKDYTFGSEYDVENVDNSAYYGQTVFKFIRDHLGYRFVLRDSDLSAEVTQGGVLDLDFSVENTGFANPIRPQKAEIILEKDGNYMKTQVDVDSGEWRSCKTSDEQIELKLPGGISEGKWNVYLRFSVGNNSVGEGYMRSVRFANSGVWNAALGANLLGSVNVKKNSNTDELTDNTFCQTGSSLPISDGKLYTVNNIIIMDGMRSGESEWTDSIKAAENGTNSMYVTNDDKYLYVTAEIVQSAVSPVYNLQIHNGSEENKFYWMYYMPNGFVYFNNGDYTGCECKRSGNYVEFKIPFGSVMNLEPGTVINDVRVSIQDSSNDWVNVGELKSGEYVISDTFTVYSVEENVFLKEHSDYGLSVETSLSNVKYQWLFNGEEIDNANEKDYTIKDASLDSVGKYSVRLTSSAGTVRSVDICTVTDVYPDEKSLRGDVNGDGEVNSADAVRLQTFILCKASDENFISENADMDSSGNIDSLDMVLLRKELIG